MLTQKKRVIGFCACASANLVLFLISSVVHSEPPKEETPKARFKQLCEKYVVDCPITTRKKLPWIERVVIERFLLDLLQHDNKWIEMVSYDGESVRVYGIKKSMTLVKDEEWNRIQKESLEAVKKLLNGVVAESVKVQTVVVIDDSAGGSPTRLHLFESKKLKPGYLKDSRIDYDAVWRAVVNSLANVPGVEVDKDSEKHKDIQGSVRTLPKVEEVDGIVTRYFAELRMKQPDKDTGFVVEIEVLLKVERRRASAKEWVLSEKGDSVSVSERKGIVDKPSSNEILKAIMEALVVK
jgi:hypothetical protein